MTYQISDAQAASHAQTIRDHQDTGDGHCTCHNAHCTARVRAVAALVTAGRANDGTIRDHAWWPGINGPAIRLA